MRHIATLFMLLACSSSAQAIERWYNAEHVALGAPLYQQHCAGCHGLQAQGAPNWQRLEPDGLYPPPPLNGSAHTWHHSLKGLYRTIWFGQNKMPAHKDRLSKAEILAILAWLQSHWPDEIYAAWDKLN